ncbi:hypothetical protein IMSAGC021_01706 [Muribaculaceae bacterium]|nr:hypothetical protein IMSAGC021_01706 [Muribaculaceae bacterium]
MAFGDVVDELHDEHCLAHTGATEQTDLTTLAVGFEKVDDLDAGEENFGADCQIVEFRRRLMDRAEFFALQFGKTVDGIADHVKESAFHLLAGRNGDGTFEVVDTHSAAKTVGTLHSHTAHGVFADMLLNFENELSSLRTCYLESRVDRGDEIVFTIENHVDHRTDYLGDLAEFFTHRVYSFLASRPVSWSDGRPFG